MERIRVACSSIIERRSQADGSLDVIEQLEGAGKKQPEARGGQSSEQRYSPTLVGLCSLAESSSIQGKMRANALYISSVTSVPSCGAMKDSQLCPLRDEKV